MTGMVFEGAIKTFFKLLKYIYKLSISVKQSRKRVSILTTWNFIVPIGVIILIKPIKDIKPIPNYTLTVPFMDLFNYTLLIF